MITLEKLRIYQKYEGDSDGFARTGFPEEQLLMKGFWGHIHCLVEDLYLVENSMASAAFTVAAQRRVEDLCDTHETQRALLEISKIFGRRRLR
ncbi:hypothetical protein [Pontibacter sp. G13]|uniref:hypothetical protein n=1 Tax=Pontibacter sp. G13 TaxID=3074898 RepID=UPI00288B8357|nr:hypothetical protein [Pontibacter sp. G13]WNJ16734.1 hypothetical protein RJD25_17850 [Pontibacter sp. G13]